MLDIFEIARELWVGHEKGGVLERIRECYICLGQEFVGMREFITEKWHDHVLH